jgi:carbon-monoxide dehydrogenase medium subunit
MIPVFELHRPSDLDEALSLMTGLDEVACYAGGTELIQVMKMGFADARHLIDLKPIAELGGIDVLPGGALRIGATVTHRDIEHSAVVAERLPTLVALEHHVANVRIRNVGTLGGNLCFAEPHSDPATLLVACEATVTLAGEAAPRRTLSLEDFLVDAFTTDRADAEILTEVTIPALPADTRLSYRRFALTERPAVSVACRVRVVDGRLADARIVVGAVGPKAVSCRAAASLDGLSTDALRKAIGDVAVACAEEVEPLDELDLDPAYLRNLVAVHVRRALADALAEVAA